MKLTELIEEHNQRVKNASQTLSKLNKRAERLGQAQEQRTDVLERIKDCEMQVSACVGVKAALKDEYATALFNEDEEQAETIRGQRRVLDDEIQQLESEIEQAEQELSKASVDGTELAEVRALLDSFKAPTYDDLLESIEAELKQANRELTRHVQSAREQLPPSHLQDREAYENVREANDGAYRAAQRHERQLAKRDAERREKMYARANAILQPPSAPEEPAVQMTAK